MRPISRQLLREPDLLHTNSFERYLEEIENYPPVTRGEEHDLARRAQEGDEDALDRLVTANLRFVISYVKKYKGWGLTLAELVSAGNEGLVMAAHRFDPDRGVKFISYAVWWVKARVRAALTEQACPVRIPVSDNAALVSIPRVESRLQEHLGRRPTNAEIADELDEKPEKIAQLRGLAYHAKSLDGPPMANDDDRSVYDIFQIAQPKNPTSGLEQDSRRAFLERLFQAHLTARERKILILYYGLDDEDPLTLAGVATYFGVTRERIRQIRNTALDKLRRSGQQALLRSMWKLSA